jgi:hypothetical protein
MTQSSICLPVSRGSIWNPCYNNVTSGHITITVQNLQPRNINTPYFIFAAGPSYPDVPIAGLQWLLQFAGQTTQSIPIPNNQLYSFYLPDPNVQGAFLAVPLKVAWKDGNGNQQSVMSYGFTVGQDVNVQMTVGYDTDGVTTLVTVNTVP